MDKKLLGQRMKQLREEHHYTKKFVADYLETSPSHYGECEKGEKLLSADFRVKLSDLYGISVEYFLRDDYQPLKDYVIDDLSNFARGLPLNERVYLNELAKTIMKHMKHD